MSLNVKNFGSNFLGYSGHPRHCIIWVHKGDYNTATLLNQQVQPELADLNITLTNYRPTLLIKQNKEYY